MDGVEATRLIAESGSPSRIVNLTTFDLDAHVVDALRAGVSGFLVKDGPADSLVGAIRTGADGEAVLSPPRHPPPTGPLRPPRRARDREHTVPSRRPHQPRARRPAPPHLGLSNAEIALEPGVGETTVKTHVAHILEKYGLRDRVQAVILAYDSGLVVPHVSGEPRGCR